VVCPKHPLSMPQQKVAEKNKKWTSDEAAVMVNGVTEFGMRNWTKVINKGFVTSRTRQELKVTILHRSVTYCTQTPLYVYMCFK
jgi:hypothetical protein